MYSFRTIFAATAVAFTVFASASPVPGGLPAVPVVGQVSQVLGGQDIGNGIHMQNQNIELDASDTPVPTSLAGIITMILEILGVAKKEPDGNGITAGIPRRSTSEPAPSGGEGSLALVDTLIGAVSSQSTKPVPSLAETLVKAQKDLLDVQKDMKTDNARTTARKVRAIILAADYNVRRLIGQPNEKIFSFMGNAVGPIDIAKLLIEILKTVKDILAPILTSISSSAAKDMTSSTLLTDIVDVLVKLLKSVFKDLGAGIQEATASVAANDTDLVEGLNKVGLSAVTDLLTN